MGRGHGSSGSSAIGDRQHKATCKVMVAGMSSHRRYSR
jgi:hypothetical protein